MSERPPHLNHFALVFPYRDRPERPWPQFWRALAAEVELLSRANGHELTFSYGNESHQDLEAYRELLEDVAAHRVAGLIFASPPWYLTGSPLLEAPGIPRVAVSPEPLKPNVLAVSLGGDLLSVALHLLVAQGRRRVAVLTVPALRPLATEALRAAGLSLPPYWVQAATYEDAEGARRATQLLLAGRAAERPDGLIIADDNLVAAATAGLAEAGLRAPGDVMVVAHANFPHVTPAAVPAVRLGYDVRAVLKACVAALDCQRQGKSVASVTTVPLVGEAGGVLVPGRLLVR